MKRKQHDSFSRVLMKLLCWMLALVLIVLAGATALFQQVLGKLHYTQSTQDLGTRLGAFVTRLADKAVPSPDFIGGTGSGIVNVLLVGSDRREEEAARSDTILLVTYHRQTGDITLTSFLRDMYVPIPGHGSNRINAAYYEGGVKLLDETLKEDFGLHIDGNVEVDFSQFSEIIDLLGGVDLELRADEASEINSHTGWGTLTEGRQHLTGWEALIYTRIRKLDDDGDFSRTSRQRKLVNALLEQYRNIKWRDLLKVMDELLPLITTDLNYGQLVLLAMEILPKLPDSQIESQRIPASGAFRDEKVDGMAVLVPDLEANRNALRKALLG